MMGAAAAVLVASLVGSAHCAGMCGGIAAFCGGVGDCSKGRSLGASGLYHLSRLASYVAVGALAGAFGTLLNTGGALVGVQTIAALLAGLAVAIVGLGLLMKSAGLDAGRAALPNWMKRSLTAIHRAAGAMPPARRAVVIGLATPLLPCGWLWAFAAIAAGTGTVFGGALIMAAFWMGTVPVLAVVGVSIATLGAKRRTALSALAGLAMITVGVYTAGVRAPLAQRVATRLATERPSAGNDVEPGSIRSACCQEPAP